MQWCGLVWIGWEFMKKVIWIAGSLIAFAGTVGLVACGGTSEYDLGGSVVGLNQPGLKLINVENRDIVEIPANAKSYTFPHRLRYGESYQVAVQFAALQSTTTQQLIQIVIQPDHLLCSVTNISGTAGTNVTTAVNVTCTAALRSVGGSISGLGESDATPTMTMAKTFGGISAPSSTGTITKVVDSAGVFSNFAFSFASVPDGATYSITIANPTGKTCTFDKNNATGTLDLLDLSDINVTCKVTST